MVQRHTQELLGTVSVGSFLSSFPIATVNEYLQAVAFIISIITGGIVIYKHFKGKKNASRKAE